MARTATRWETKEQLKKASAILPFGPIELIQQSKEIFY